MHPYEDISLTQRQLLSLLSAVLGDRVKLYEKFDGINLMLQRRDGVFHFARSVNEIKSGGFPLDQLFDRFPKAKHVGQTLYEAMLTFIGLDETMNSIRPTEESTRDDTHWHSVEIIHSDHTNVIQYSKNAIVVHPVGVNDDGVIFNIKPYEHIYGCQADGWTIVGPVEFRAKTSPAYDFAEFHICGNLTNPEGTLGEEYAFKIRKMFSEQHKFPSDVCRDVANRIVGIEGHKTLTEIKKTWPRRDAETISKFVNNGVQLMRNVRRENEIYVNDFASKVMKNASSALITEDHESAMTKLKFRYFTAERKIRIAREKKFDADIEMVGEFEKITSTMEGIVFQWPVNGKLYKLTGYYRNVNQVMGFSRFEK